MLNEVPKIPTQSGKSRPPGRKLKLQMQMSLDGFVSTGSNDEQKWVTWAWEEIKDDVLDLLDSCDTHVIGRKLAVDYIPHWQNTFAKSDDPMYEVAKRIVAMKKYVFTKTLKTSEWNNTDLLKGDLTEEINNLKNQSGKDILVVGGSSFVSELIEKDLIDELHFYLNPVVIGKGESIFSSLNKFKKINLKKVTKYDCGIVLLVYENNF